MQLKAIEERPSGPWSLGPSQHHTTKPRSISDQHLTAHVAWRCPAEEGEEEIRLQQGVSTLSLQASGAGDEKVTTWGVLLCVCGAQMHGGDAHTTT